MKPTLLLDEVIPAAMLQGTVTCDMVGCSLSLSRPSVGRCTAFQITLPHASRAAELAAQFVVSSVDVSPVDASGNAGAGSKVISSV